MRLCRYRQGDQFRAGFYDDEHIVPLGDAAAAYEQATHNKLPLSEDADLLNFLPPGGKNFNGAKQLVDWLTRNGSQQRDRIAIKTASVELTVPIPRPNKLFLLAGNYAEHIREGGGHAAERAATFPYVFMKPPSTTLTAPGKPVTIPEISPHAIDWECELAVVIGKPCKAVKEAEALNYVAGYTVINDISDRKFRPNPGRTKREKDTFFDWLHGKWADSFCPCGPCITSADEIPNPQNLQMKLTLNDEVKQNASTALQIFPVAAVIEFISSFVTLEPGDIISTGTPAGVGNASGTYVKPGDVLKASISSIGTLISPIAAE